jgi:hypothetical protein
MVVKMKVATTALSELMSLLVFLIQNHNLAWLKGMLTKKLADLAR